MLIPLLAGWHEHHERARLELRDCLAAGESLLLVGHTLLETYSVLTRYPPPNRVPPEFAVRMIRERLVARGRVIAPAPEDYAGFLQSLAERSVAGGQTYDALILVTARNAGADALLTFNIRHFERLAGGGIAVRVPPLR